MREIGYKIKLLAIGILFILNLVLFLISHFPPYAAGNAQEGKPQRMAKQLNLYGRITDIAVCHDYLYVLYGDLNILECRTLDGAYLHAYCVDIAVHYRLAHQLSLQRAPSNPLVLDILIHTIIRFVSFRRYV